jgi:hypothetical protein
MSAMAPLFAPARVIGGTYSHRVAQPALCHKFTFLAFDALFSVRLLISSRHFRQARRRTRRVALAVRWWAFRGS